MSNHEHIADRMREVVDDLTAMHKGCIEAAHHNERIENDVEAARQHAYAHAYEYAVERIAAVLAKPGRPGSLYAPGTLVRFEGCTYRITAPGDVPGTVDMVPHSDRGDLWRNVPPSALELIGNPGQLSATTGQNDAVAREKTGRQLR